MLCPRALLLALAFLAAVPAAGGVALPAEAPQAAERGAPTAPALPLTGSRQDAAPGAILPLPTRIAEEESRQGHGPSPRAQGRQASPPRGAGPSPEAPRTRPLAGDASGADRCRLHCVYRL